LSGEITNIPDRAFEENNAHKTISLTRVLLPDTVTIIGYMAFANNLNLTDVYIPDSVVKIGEGVFYECTELTRIRLSESISTIEDSTFYGCTGDHDWKSGVFKLWI